MQRRAFSSSGPSPGEDEMTSYINFKEPLSLFLLVITLNFVFFIFYTIPDY